MNVVEKERVPLKEVDEPPDPPICKLYGWREWRGFLWAERFEDHPKLGDGPKIPGHIFRSGQIVWIDKHLGLARTRNTSYILIGPERGPL